MLLGDSYGGFDRGRGILNWSKGLCEFMEGIYILHGIAWNHICTHVNIYSKYDMISMIYDLHKEELIRVASHRNPPKVFKTLVFRILHLERIWVDSLRSKKVVSKGWRQYSCSYPIHIHKYLI